MIAPEITGLSYHIAPHRNDREIFMVFIPPQPPPVLPFIVKGGIINTDKYTTSLFAVPIRQQDSNVSARLTDIQRYLARESFRPTEPPTPTDPPSDTSINSIAKASRSIKTLVTRLLRSNRLLSG